MLPRFSLPAAEPGSNFNLATRPKQVQAWLGRLPIAHAPEAASELTDYIATCVRVRTPSDRMEDILGLVMPTAWVLVDELREQCTSEGLPLPPSHQQTAELCTRLLSELGHACKMIVLERAGRKFTLFGAKPHDQYLYLLVQILRQSLELNLEMHQSPPPGTWRDLHQAYHFALSSGVARDPPQGNATEPSLEDQYKSTLLFALADPFRIPREEMAQVKSWINANCSLLDLIPCSDDNRHGSVYAIALDSDNPVIVLARESDMEIEGWDMLVNSTRLVKQLALLASQRAREHGQSPRGRKGGVHDLGELELLHRLRMHWGGSVQRMGFRHPRYDKTRFEICFGFQAVHSLLRIGEEEERSAPSPFSYTPKVASCMLVNDSVGGLALARERPYGFQLRIGDLVAVRQEGLQDWGLGIVRWFRTARAGRAVFGLQLIAPKGLGVELHDPRTGLAWPGLLIPSTPALRQGEMVLAPPGKLAIGMALDIMMGHGPGRIHLERLAEFSPSFESYYFREI